MSENRGERLFSVLKSKLLEPLLTCCLKEVFGDLEPCVRKIAGLARRENPTSQHFS